MDRSCQSGSIEDLKPWLDAHPHEIERTFEDKIVMPDFIDPHLHPLLGAMVSANPYYLSLEAVLCKPLLGCSRLRASLYSL